MHDCRAMNCGKQVPDSMLMCKRHWYMVPVKTRHRVFDTNKKYDDNPAAYYQAVHDAVNAVLEKENKQLLTGNLNAV